MNYVREIEKNLNKSEIFEITTGDIKDTFIYQKI